MWMGLGHALAGLGRVEEAVEAYRESVALRRELGQANLATESLRRGSGQGSGHALDGAVNPFQVYLTCYRVLKAGRDPRAQEVLRNEN